MHSYKRNSLYLPTSAVKLTAPLRGLMNQEKLIQIDTELIALLGKRIAVLAELEPPYLDEQSDNLTPFLAQAGVAEFVWKNIVEPIPLMSKYGNLFLA